MSDTGVLFPIGPDGRRASLHVNQEVWADAASAADSALAERIRESGAWRKDYVELARDVTQAAGRSREAATLIARAGLESARSRLVFGWQGEDLPLAQATGLPPRRPLTTQTVTGRAAPDTKLVIPYRDERLRGDALRRRLAVWVGEGVVEPSAATALHTLIDNPSWLRLDGHRVVVVGAGAQTSPLPVLSSWGVETVAIDLPRPDLWQRLLATAAEGAGVVHVPAATGSGGLAERAGANIVEDVPELARWLGGFLDKPLVMGFYVYADGPAHVQATVAADLLTTFLAEGGQTVVPAFAGTPTDCYLVPEDVVEDSNARRRQRPRRALELAVRGVTAGHFYHPAYGDPLRSAEDDVYGVADALVGRQGPNYALAKRLQRWRAIEQWSAGKPASFNVAPPAWTASVTKNRMFAAGYYGARFAGLEVFSPETMQALMTALLVHDLHVPPRDDHPELVVTRDGVHGGYWRVPHDIRSTLLYTSVVGLPASVIDGIRAR